MVNNTVIFPDKEIILPLRYFGSVDYYASMAAYGKVVLQRDQRYNKRDKGVHRMDIVDVHGPLTLTVPVVRPDFEPSVKRRATWADVAVSDHGAWWHVHRVALESAYGRTPFFEFYIDRLAPFFTRSVVIDYTSIADYDIALTRVICEILGVDFPKVEEGNIERYKLSVEDQRFSPLPYWQARSKEFGFVPHLSILDLIFSLGPESPVYLRSLVTNPIN